MLVFLATKPNDREKKAKQHRGEDPDPDAGGRRPKHRGCMPKAQPLTGELPPMKEAVRPDGSQRDQKAEGAGTGEHGTLDDAGRQPSGEPGFAYAWRLAGLRAFFRIRI